MPVHLVVLEGKPLGAVIPLRTDPFVIGKAPGCQLRPRGDEVSDRQCAIFKRGPHVTVKDLGSTLGTLVNDRCLRRGDETRVGDGDRLQVGHLIFAIRIETEGPDVGEFDEFLRTPGGGRVGKPQAMSGFFPGQSGVYAAPTGSPPTPVLVAAATRSVVAPRRDGLTVAFSSWEVDDESGATCLGVSPSQLAEEADQRALRETLRELALAKRPCRLVLNLSALEDLPSLVVASFMGLARRCEADGGELRLCSAPPKIRRQLKLLRFEDVAALYDDRQEACADAWV